MQRQKVENTALFEEIRAMLAQGLDARFTVSGNSMWPILVHNRDSVVITPCTKPKRGDVVLFCPVEGQYLLHRIYRIKKDRIYTCGDGNCHRDGDFPVSSIMGKVVTLERKGKQIPCTRWWYRCYSTLWRWCYPFRRPLLKLLRTLISFL